MLNLLKTDLKRIFKDKLFLIVCLIGVGLSIFTTGLFAGMEGLIEETLENEIMDILKSDHVARADDMALYANYCFRKVDGVDLGLGWLVTIFSDKRFRISHGIAPYSTISRVRRKIQEKYPELRATPEQIKEKKELERKYKAYAKKK